MIKLTTTISLEDFTLIIPSVAVGNVGQLAVDLLISNLNLDRIGRMINPGFIPVVGQDPYNENSSDICTAVDVYANIEKKMVTLQIRSPLVNRSTEFFNDLQQFIKEQKISKTVILTSSYAYEKRDNQLRTTSLRYIASPAISSENKQLFEDLQWMQHEPNTESGISTENTTLVIPGGGYARTLFTVLANANLPCIILFKFCSEGDNIPDALDLTKYLNQWLKLIKIDANGSLNVKYPPSWKHLFGNPPIPEIY